MIQRTDRQTLDGIELESNGWLRASAALTRTGVFSYRNEDGSLRRELRPPQEVFRSDLISMYAGLPLTVGHPAEPLDATTTRAAQVGSVAGTPVRESDLLVAELLITDITAIEAIQREPSRSASATTARSTRLRGSGSASPTTSCSETSPRTTSRWWTEAEPVPSAPFDSTKETS